ncbi:GntR family transcriptional regulator [Thermodesulfobacteriota bacterium]
MVSRNDPTPLYMQIAREIRSAIRSGKYPPGSRIPSESALSKKYNVGRITTRQALNILVDENLIIKKQGQGTFVSSELIHQELSDLQTITEVLLSKGVKPRIRVISNKTVLPPEKIRIELFLGKGEKVIQIKRLYFIGPSPLCLVNIYLPFQYKEIAAPLKKAVPETETTYTLFERAGIKPDEAAHVIKAMEADKDASRWLKVPVGTPILGLERTTYLADGTPLECLFFQYRADKFGFSIKVPRVKRVEEGLYDSIVNGVYSFLNPQVV